MEGGAPSGAAPGGSGEGASVAPVAESSEPKQPGQAESGEERAPRKLAPIPPGRKPGEKTEQKEKVKAKDRPRLPGVTSRDNYDEESLELPRRGRDGKFSSKEAAQEDAERELVGEGFTRRDDELAVEKPELPPGVETPKPTGLKILGKEYKDAAAVEQMVKSVQGQFATFKQNEARITEERDYGYRAANAWQKVAEEREAELQRYRAGGAPSPNVAPQNAPAQDAPAGLDVDSLLGDIDVAGFETLALSERGGLQVAAKYLTAEILRSVVDKILPDMEGKFNQTLAPFQQTAEEQAEAAHVAQVADSMRMLKDARGNPAFPELDDEAALMEVSAVAKGSGMSKAELMTAQGIMRAIGMYRMMKSFGELPETPASNPTPSIEAPPVGAAPGTAALSESGASDFVPGMQRRFANPNSREARLIQSLERGLGTDRKLGFARNPRVD